MQFFKDLLRRLRFFEILGNHSRGDVKLIPEVLGDGLELGFNGSS
ncbi:MAG TPA: hypothetical protein VIT23_00375 [Terrimicrobiaceae bacterium]